VPADAAVDVTEARNEWAPRTGTGAGAAGAGPKVRRAVLDKFRAAGKVGQSELARDASFVGAKNWAVPLSTMLCGRTWACANSPTPVKCRRGDDLVVWHRSPQRHPMSELSS
jgi:hypothetical protein